jgi:cytochrome c
MDILDKLVLPQSLEHITLLHFLSVVALIVFIPYISMVLGGMIVSLYYKRKGTVKNDAQHTQFAKEVIALVTVNKSAGLALGIVPLVILLISFTQVYHLLNYTPVKFFLLAFVTVGIALILINVYRYSFVFKDILSSVEDTAGDNINGNVAADIRQFSPRISQLNDWTGKWGLGLLCVGTYFFVAGLTHAINAVDGDISKSLLGSLLSITIISRWLYFIAASISLTASVILFYYFYWDGGKKDVPKDYTESLKKQMLWLLFIALLALPFFILVNTVLLPASSLSLFVFAGLFLALLFIFLLYQLIYNMIKENHLKYVHIPFIFLLLAVIALALAEQTAIANTSLKNTLIQADNYNTLNSESTPTK